MGNWANMRERVMGWVLGLVCGCKVASLITEKGRVRVGERGRDCGVCGVYV